MTTRKTQRERIIKNSADEYQIAGGWKPKTVVVLREGEAKYAPPGTGSVIWLHGERLCWRIM